MEALDNFPALIQKAIEEQANNIRAQFEAELRSRNLISALVIQVITADVVYRTRCL